ERGVAFDEGDREERREERRALARAASGVEPLFEPVEPITRSIVGRDAGRVRDLNDEGIEPAVRVIRRAEIAEQRRWLDARLVDDGGGDPRLADAGLAGEEHHLTVATARLGPPLAKQRHLAIAADQRGRAQAPGADDPRGRPPETLRLVESLQRLGPEVLPEK